jgi:hypothetical protein
MENKKSFLLYCDSFSMVKQLPDDVAGRLLKHIFSYVNDENPISEELILNIAFEPIKMQLKMDFLKWSDETKDRSAAGKKGMANRWAEHNKSKQSITKDNSDNDNVSVKDKKINTPSLVDKKIIEGSPYGDGELHFLVNDFYKKNKEKYELAFYKDFLAYWTAPIQLGGAAKGKEQWRTQKTFELIGRLSTSYRLVWQKNKDIPPNGVKRGKIQGVYQVANEALAELLNEY